MDTRPTPRSRDGTRPRSASGTRPTSSPRPCSSHASSSRTGVSPSPPASDKPVPSFLRPTVSSSLRDTSSSSTTQTPSSSKARAVTPKRPSTADKAPARPRPATPKLSSPAQSAPPRSVTPQRTPAQSAPRPVTPQRTPAQSATTPNRSPAQQKPAQGAPRQIIAPMDKAKAKASASRWSVVSPRQLMQKASNAFKVGKSRSKKNKDLAGPAAAAASGGKDAADVIQTETSARATMPVEEQQQHPAPETTPLDLQLQEEVVVEPNAAQSAQEEATSQEAVSAEIETEEQRGRDEQASAGYAEKAKGVHDEKVAILESEAAEVDKPVPGEKPQAGIVEETAKEAETNTEEEPPAAVVDAAAKEPAALLNSQDEPATSMVREDVVEKTNVEERQQQQEEPPKHEEVKGNSEASAISEEPKEQAGESKLTAASRATSMPAASLEEALEEMDTPTNATTTSRSEPVTPAKEAISKDKPVIDTFLSASAPTTPLRGGGAAKRGMTSSSASMAKIPEEAVRLTFIGSKVKTALEKRPEEAHPKKKEVARSNDVLEETKSKLLEKKASKVKALVGAFEVVMDSPRASTPGKSPRPGDW